MIFGITTLTFVHVALSLIGIVSGFVVVIGLILSKRLDGWTALFLATTLATSATGFAFPFNQLLPSHVVGVISLIVLAAAIVARYHRNMGGAWRIVYTIGAVAALYLNVFVLVAQIFQKTPALQALAPTQSEPPFLVAQLAVLIVFIVLGALANMRFRSQPVVVALTP